MARTLIAGPDAFTGADGTDLISGGGWTLLHDVAWGCSVRIKTNKACGHFSTASAADTTTQSRTASARWNGAGTFSADQYAKATISGLGSASADKRVGLIVRASTDTDANRDYYVLYVADSATPTTILARIANGTFTVLDTRTSIAWANNDTIGLEASGTGATVTLSVFRNSDSTPTYTYDDTDATRITSAGKPGLYIAGHGVDNADTRIDDWEAGDVTGGAATPSNPPLRAFSRIRSILQH